MPVPVVGSRREPSRADGRTYRSPESTVMSNVPKPAADAAATSPTGLGRSFAVWGVFVLASVSAIGVLQLSHKGVRASASNSAITPSAAALNGHSPLAAPGAFRATTITPRFTDIDRQRWKCIVIHHSGTPAGDAASLERKHVQDGLTGLGFHFIIGNGQGLEDGQIVVGYRWDRQLAGAHVAQSLERAGTTQDSAQFFNQHAVAICLVGNGERRAFTERQVHQLVELTRQLQAELGIPASQVHLHSTLSGVASPGQFFPSAEVMSQILP